jgi:hypothetical protein
MNLQEHIRKVLREDRKPSNFLKRRLGNLDYEVESGLNGPFGGANICIFFKSEEDFFESVMENAIDAMYFNYFSHIDDNSGEWANEYLDMVDYIRNKYKDKIMKHYDDNCGSGSIPLKENIRRVLKETLESKWNNGNYDYQHGYCHYFAYDIIGKIKKRFPNKKVNYYMILANEVDIIDGTIVQNYLIHVYIQIDNMLLDSNGITTHDKAWKMAEEWEQRQAHLVPKSYETKMWEEESDTIPEMFFNNSFCNTGRVKKDVEKFLNNPIVQRILRYK